MEKTVKFIALSLLGSWAFAGPIGPPSGAPILNSEQPQIASFNVSSGTVRSKLTLPNLSAGCLVTDPTTGVTSQACASGGGSSGAAYLAVNQNGTQVTSPTVALNALSPPFIVTSVGGGTTAQWRLDPSSVTLQGNFYSLSGLAASTGTLTNSVISLGASTGTILISLNATKVSTGTIAASVVAVSVATGTIQTQVTNIAGAITSLAFSTTSLQNQISGHHPVSLTTGVVGNIQIGNMDNGTNANSTTVFYGDGHWGVPGGSGSSSLAVTTGTTAGFSTVISTPTSVLVAHGEQFLVSVPAGTSAFMQLNPSSVTLRGDSVVAAVTAGTNLGIINVGGDVHYPQPYLLDAISLSTVTLSERLVLPDGTFIISTTTLGGSSGSSSPIEIQYEGVSITTSVALIDYVGPGVSVVGVNDNVTVTISSWSGGGSGAYLRSGYSGRFSEAVNVTTSDEALDQIFAFEYTAPGITLATSPSATVRELGTTLSTVTLTATTVEKSSPILTVQWKANSTVIKTSTTPTATGGIEVYIDTGTRIATVAYTAVAGDGTSITTSNAVTFTFVYPFYYGVGAQSLTEAQVQALTKLVKTKSDTTTTTSPSTEVYYFAYPQSYGSLTSILDTNGFETIGGYTQRSVSMTMLDATSQSYYIYEFNTPTTQTSFSNQYKF